jgi:ssDNA thymidine ADP-ribosyltransferase, DarT
MGILASEKLKEDERSIFTSIDLMRLDGHEGYISCSIEYPNAWYFAKARLRDVLFEDWVVLFITPRYLWMPGTRFCPRNAAADYGRSVSEGKTAFLALFANEVRGAHGKTFLRGAAHLLCCPTDEQAEVLIPDQIEMADILGIAVRSETQAKNGVARLRLICIPENKFEFVIAPDLFSKYILSKLIHSGRRPIESLWMPRGET